MARHYARKAFLKAAPNSLLRRYLAERGLGEGIQWKALPENMIDEIERCIERAGEQKRSEIDNDFWEINDLADEGGARTLIAEGKTRHHGVGTGIDLTGAAAKAKTPLHFAFQVFLEHRDIFKVAWDFHRSDRISLTRWGTRGDLAGCNTDASAPATKRLGERLSEYYMLKEGRGQYCHVDHWERGNELYWFAYPEDYGHASLGYDSRHQLRSQAQRPVFYIVFIFCKEEGSLRYFVEGDRQTRFDCQRIFGETVLKVKLLDPPTEQVNYELDALMDRNYPLRLEVGDDVEEVRAACGEEFVLVVPGVRPEGSNGDDQVRVLTPRAAMEKGADYLVVGRPITASADASGAARGILRMIR